MFKPSHKSTSNYLNSILGFMSKKPKQREAQTTISAFNKPDPRGPSYAYKAENYQSAIRLPKKRETPDYYKFNYSFASYVHHGSRRQPIVTSLMDLTDSTSNISLLPRRRLHGNPFETLSIKNGDDAMIVSSNLLGVADGVSGWSGEHSDSGLFARSFLENISRNYAELSYINSENLANIEDDDLRVKLDQSYEESLRVMRTQRFKGSSTLVAAMIVDKELKIMNIGDSRVFVIRNEKIVFTNREQYISGFCPEQVGTTEEVKLPSSVVQLYGFGLEENDLILLCSDGVTDNLFEDEILEFINEKVKSGSNLQELSHSLLLRCKSVAYDNYCVSPYVEKVNEISNNFITGGKLDDISVCFARVVLNE